MNPPTATPAPALLVADDLGWVRAVESAADTLGRDVVRMGSAAEAITVISRQHPFRQLLAHPESAGGLFACLVDLTCNEADSGVDLIVLGPESVIGAHQVARPDPVLIASALLLPPRQGRPSARDPIDPADLESLLAGSAIRVRYQPIVTMADRAVFGFELLARLDHPTLGMVPPARFIPIAERMGLGMALTQAVARPGLAGFAGLEDAPVALNIPLNVLQADWTVPVIAEIAAQAGVPAASVIIELTESQRVNDPSGLRDAVERWHAAGFRLAIDDAGPGVPNHRALFKLPFDFVKLDKSVVRQALRSAPARAYLVRTVAAAHEQGLTVIAEGLEDEAAWDLLSGLEVEAAQGFMIGRPMPPAAIPAWRSGWSNAVS